MSQNRAMLLVLYLFAASVVALMVLTGTGQDRRGGRAGFVVLAGLFFPITWVVWYVKDRRDGFRTGVAGETRRAPSRPPAAL